MSRAALDVPGLSEAKIKQLRDEGVLVGGGLAELFEVFADDARRTGVEELNGWGAKSVENVRRSLAAVEDSGRPLSRILQSLGIRHVGSVVSKIVSTRLSGPEELLSLAEGGGWEAKIGDVDGVGPKVVQALEGFAADPKAVDDLKRLLKRVAVVEEEKQLTGGKLQGLKVVFTGKLESRGRDEAKRHVKAQGGETPSSLSKSTDLLVVGEKAGKKIDKAKELGVRVVTEESFFKDDFL